ncbi:hypothetical protein D3C76_1657440 [compost metagenome]
MTGLLRVTTDGFEQLFDAFGALFIAQLGIGDVCVGVSFDNFIHQTIHRPTCSRDEMQCFGAVSI